MTFDIVHATTKVSFSGAGVPAANQKIASIDWNQVHASFASGSGISITSDNGTPPTFTISASAPSADFLPSLDNTFNIGSQTFRWKDAFFGGTVSSGKEVSGTVTATTLSVGGSLKLYGPTGIPGTIKFTQAGTGFSVTADGAAIILDGCPDLRPSGDMCSDLGTDLLRYDVLMTPTWRNVGVSAPTGLTMQMGQYAIILQDSLPGSIAVDQIGHANLVDFGTPSFTFRNAYFGGTVSAGSGFQTPASTILFAPSGAGASKVLTSDASGNATWQVAAGGGVSGGTTNAIPLWASATTLTSSIMGQMSVTQVSVGGNFIPSASMVNVATLGSAANGFQKLYLANDNTAQIVTQGGTIATDALIIPTSDQNVLLGTDAKRLGLIRTIGLQNSSGPLSFNANGNAMQWDIRLDPITGFNLGTLFPTGDENLVLGTPSLRTVGMYFSRTVSFGGDGTSQGSRGYSSNTSAAMAFGGAATSTGTATGTARLIPIRINGTMWYIQAFPGSG